MVDRRPQHPVRLATRLRTPSHGGTAGVFLTSAALVALVAIAAAGNPVSVPLRTGRPDRMELILVAGAVAIVSGALAFAITILVHRVIAARVTSPPTLRQTGLRAFPIAAAATAALCLAVITGIEMQHVEVIRIIERVTGTGGREGVPLGITDERGMVLRAGEGEDDSNGAAVERLPPVEFGVTRYSRMLLAVVAAALAVLAFTRIAARRSRVRPLEATGVEAAAAVHDALAGTIDGMLADPDPRRAVIGAYARLLEDLDARGIGRLPQEAPHEHLKRALSAVHVRPAPLARLIQLFERARFSSYRITSTDRVDALDALHAIAQELSPAVATGSESFAGDAPK